MNRATREPRIDLALERLIEAFAVEPTDRAGFETLERELVRVGAFGQLAGVYECRLAALERDDPGVPALLLRLARLLDQELGARKDARRCYEELLRRSPRQREALAGLRGLLASTGEVAAALQVAEIEEKLPLAPDQRARLLVEVAELWLQFGDKAEARSRFERALELDAQLAQALHGLAALAAAEGRADEALRLHERRIAGLEGPERARALAELVHQLPERADEQTRRLLLAAAREAADRRPALERLIALERARGAHERVHELQRELWSTLASDPERLALALEAGAAEHEAGRHESALFWAERAGELGVDSVDAQQLCARIYRDTGSSGRLIRALESIARLGASSAALDLELATLHERRGDPARAVAALRTRFVSGGCGPEALALLDRCLARLERHEHRATVLEARVLAAASADERAALLVELGDLCAAALDDLATAEQAYARAIAASPGDPLAAERLAGLLAKAGRRDDLAAFLLERGESDSSPARRAWAWTALAQLRRSAFSDPAGARDAALRALQSESSHAPALAALREVADAAGKPAWQLEARELELALDPSGPRAPGLLREIAKLARELGDLVRARRAAELGVELSLDAESLRLLTEIARDLGDGAGQRRALEGLEMLLEDEPQERAEVLARLAELALEQADPTALERATRWYRESLAVAPRPSVRRELIDLLRRRGDHAGLALELERALAEAAGPEQAKLRLELARALVELGDGGRAAQVLASAFELDPAADEIADALERLLRDQGRTSELAPLLERRLASERDRTRQRELALRLAGLLLDAQGDAARAVSILRDRVEPGRCAELEQLYDRALEQAGDLPELERWLRLREPHAQGDEGARVLLRLASVQRSLERPSDAFETLQRAGRISPAAREQARASQLALLRASAEGPPLEAPQQAALLRSWIERTDDPGERRWLRVERARRLASAEEAIAELELADGEVGLDAAAAQLLARLCERANRPAKLAHTLERLCEVAETPDEKVGALLRLAELRVASADLDAAERALEAARELAPERPEPIESLVDLYERSGSAAKLEELLKARLARGGLPPQAASALLMRLARSLRARGELDEVISVLAEARSAGLESPEADELLYACVVARWPASERAGLCRARAATAQATDRVLWLWRWLDALEQAGANLEARLAALDALRAERGADLELCELRVRILRDAADPGRLAEALLEALARHEPGSRRRRLLVREALGLLEGPLADPTRALTLVEAELPVDPDLRARGAELAARLGDARREATLLTPIVLGGGPLPAPEQVRRLALALAALGHGEQARPLLWQALGSSARDPELVAALERIERERGKSGDLARVLEHAFAACGAERRLELAREGFELAERRVAPQDALRWLRRRRALEALAPELRLRLAELEYSAGDPGGCLEALRGLRVESRDPAERTRLLEREAAVLTERGHLELAREAYDTLLQSTPRPPLAWLQAQERILHALGRGSERAGLLTALVEHPDSDPRLRARWQEERVAHLRLHPDLRARAAAALRASFDGAEPAEGPAALARARELLRLYEELEQPLAWCEVAERTLELVPGDQRISLQRELARRLTSELGAREAAIAHWEALLARAPNDPEALEELSVLLRAPGREARRLEILRLRCELGGEAELELRVEAARVAWESLGDVRAALLHVERALELDSRVEGAHEIRAGLCARLDRAAEELESLELLLELRPRGPHAASHNARVATLLARAARTHTLAREAAERALELAPADPEIRRSMRQIFEFAGAPARALELLREELADARAEECPTLLRRFAWLAWSELGDAERVCEALEALAGLEPPSAEDEQRWADALLALGHGAESLRHRRAALEGGLAGATAESWLALARDLLALAGDARAALDACDRALASGPRAQAVLELRAELHARLGDAAAEIGDLESLAELVPGPEAAALLARAGRLAAESLGDRMRAQAFYRAALTRDPSSIDALIGAGRLALEREHWVEAERVLGLACALLPGVGDKEALAATARLAAHAALARTREREAFRYLELALREEPSHAETLEQMAELALRIGAFDRARQALESRIALDDLDSARRRVQLLRLAEVCEAQGELGAAVDVLERAIALNPGEPELRERALGLLERLGALARLVGHLDDWIAHAPEPARAGLELRAARIERRAGTPERARSRLERLWSGGDAEACGELAALVLQLDGPFAAYEFVSGAREAVASGTTRGGLSWVGVQALTALGRMVEAARWASESLADAPDNLDAALLVARHLGFIGDFAAAVERLERSLDATKPQALIEAELREAVGRALAGPLEDVARAERSLRRAVECNPLRTSAREALADLASFLPGSHREALALHRELLAGHPARVASWRALARIADHRQLHLVRSTCEAVPVALAASGPCPVRALHIDAGPPLKPAISAGAEVLRALAEAGELPRDGTRSGPQLPPAIQAELRALVGGSFRLEDAEFLRLWREAGASEPEGGTRSGLRARWRLSRGLRALEPGTLAGLEPGRWREEMLAWAAAAALRSGHIGLRDALVALLAATPATAELDLESDRDLSPIVPLAPPARALFERIALASVECIEEALDSQTESGA